MVQIDKSGRTPPSACSDGDVWGGPGGRSEDTTTQPRTRIHTSLQAVYKRNIPASKPSACPRAQTRAASSSRQHPRTQPCVLPNSRPATRSGRPSQGGRPQPRHHPQLKEREIEKSTERVGGGPPKEHHATKNNGAFLK